MKLGVREVADRAKVTPNTVSRVEQDETRPRGPQPVTVEAIRRVYEDLGIQFIPENGGGAGVRLAKPRAPVGQPSEGEAGIIETNEM